MLAFNHVGDIRWRHGRQWTPWRTYPSTIEEHTSACHWDYYLVSLMYTGLRYILLQTVILTFSESCTIRYYFFKHVDLAGCSIPWTNNYKDIRAYVLLRLYTRRGVFLFVIGISIILL